MWADQVVQVDFLAAKGNELLGDGDRVHGSGAGAVSTASVQLVPDSSRRGKVESQNSIQK